MEVWSAKPCNFCQGTGVRAEKAVYDRWARVLARAQLKVAGGKPVALFQLVRHQLELEAAEYPACSWCDGEKIMKKREPDENPDTAQF